MKKLKEQKGITLVALVITIIILLLLAAISIQSLTNTGLFEKADEAKRKTKNAQAEENEVIENYLAQIDLQTGRLSGKVQPGDYVLYKPDKPDTESTASIKEKLDRYSGNTDNTKNTTDAITQQSLKWRVLDVKNGKVRLISEVPTTSKIALNGYNGYNNAVYLLDKTCETLYSKSGYAENVQNLKIEDIQNKMSIDYTKLDPMYGKTDITPINKKYPSILAQEEGQTISGIEQPEKRLGLSEQKQTELIEQTEMDETESWILKHTHWNKEMADTDFKNSIYYNLFIAEKNEDDTYSNYSDYWLSSRVVHITSERAGFNVRLVHAGWVWAWGMCNSKGAIPTDNTSYALRPVVTLNSNVLVKSGEGTSTVPYEIGL